eukprot:gnl/TRDRNA2_/TRDRNA2_83919_c0_seq1.p1 gnl/TRDRNA2_/TRDRNA2_83919_c0~~gnl/TRDRNA2_/TRDRNA2_83919_c0_seq1.p1  ORF type:complete len:660 (-),score=111.72 gnl/TRDRNA2_/TRDRNA2_83919_c0_seq1:49-1995(-)
MARVAWAAKAQLLTKLRVHAPKPAGGLAPLELVPEVCGHLRGFTPSELRIVLAAYSRHLDVRVTPGDSRADGQTLKLTDLLVQLLAGGSRLGTTVQLLEAADAIADFAPCGSRAASEFWDAFAARVSRLAAKNSLVGDQLLSVFRSCAAWTTRCRGAAPHSGSSTGPWAHMLRAAGGRLAHPEHLDTLPLPDVVSAARFAAQCGEPQLRLAAAIGLRVGHNAAELSAKELIELIGASGRLGGRLHMMTRALADQLEPQVGALPASSLVQLCCYLGELEMFPQRLGQELTLLLPSAVPRLEQSDMLPLLRACGRLRWRVPGVLGPLVEAIRAEQQLESMDGGSLGRTLFELYRLDVWDESLVAAICARLGAAAGRQVPRKIAANVLLALAYFAPPVPDLYRHLLKELLRARDLPPKAMYQLKTVELALRVGHAHVTFEDLGPLVCRWLFSIRRAKMPPEPRGESAFADDVSAVGRRIAFRHVSEVEVGPYILDFAGVVEDEGSDSPPEWDDTKPTLSVKRHGIALEADGPSHFYRPHGAPWHWTSSSKLRHRLLTAGGIQVAHVPYYDWVQLENVEEKESYLAELLINAQRARPQWLGGGRGRPVQADDVEGGDKASAAAGTGPLSFWMKFPDRKNGLHPEVASGPHGS